MGGVMFRQRPFSFSPSFSLGFLVRFAWGLGYGAFSVSHSDVSRVARYIANQEEHHRKRSYSEEYRMFVRRYGLEWRAEENH
jgi:hypothetical protein